MPIYGDIKTVALPDLLQWLGDSRRTGVLELERHHVRRSIEFRKGWISGCMADDPPARMGQFLLARGKITKEQLRDGLAQQERDGRNLGLILLSSGALKQADLAELLTEKAKETVYGLFEWEDAVFRYHDGSTLDPDQIEICISVRDLLMHGLQRLDELRRIRTVFTSSGVVLAQTDRPLPDAVLQSPMAQRILNAVDGSRSLAEIPLHVRASEFPVVKLLHQLHDSGNLRIVEVRPVDRSAASVLDDVVDEPEELLPDADDETGAEVVAGSDAAAAESPGVEIEVASRLMDRGEFDAAIALLEAAYRADPNDKHARRLLTSVEKTYVETARRRGLSDSMIPSALQNQDLLQFEELSPGALFLLSQIDGKADIKSLFWTTPMREFDVLQGLQQLLDKDLIELRSADVEQTEPTPA